MKVKKSFKKVAIVDNNPERFYCHPVNLKRKTIEKCLTSFDDAKSLLAYLRGLKSGSDFKRFPDYILVNIQHSDLNIANLLNQVNDLIGVEDNPEVFILSDSESKLKQDLAMQYPFVGAYLKMPVPDDLVEVLIAGSIVDNPPH